VRADLDTLVIALYVTIDKLLDPRRGPGRPPKLADAELVCLAVAQVLLGFGSERRWLRFAGQRLGHLFPYLPTASADNRRLRRAGPLVALAIQDLAAHTPSWGDQLRLVDSTPVPCAASRQTVKRSALAGQAGRATARATTATSGGSGSMSWPPVTGCRSPGAWPAPSWVSARSSRPCWTTSAPNCARAWSSWATRALPVVTSTSSSPAMAPGCCDPTGLMSPAGWGRWGACGSGSRCVNHSALIYADGLHDLGSRWGLVVVSRSSVGGCTSPVGGTGAGGARRAGGGQRG
jgi:hypothetical protein